MATEEEQHASKWCWAAEKLRTAPEREWDAGRIREGLWGVFGQPGTPVSRRDAFKKPWWGSPKLRPMSDAGYRAQKKLRYGEPTGTATAEEEVKPCNGGGDGGRVPAPLRSQG